MTWEHILSDQHPSEFIKASLLQNQWFNNFYYCYRLPYSEHRFDLFFEKTELAPTEQLWGFEAKTLDFELNSTPVNEGVIDWVTWMLHMDRAIPAFTNNQAKQIWMARIAHGSPQSFPVRESSIAWQFFKTTNYNELQTKLNEFKTQPDGVRVVIDSSGEYYCWIRDDIAVSAAQSVDWKVYQKTDNEDDIPVDIIDSFNRTGPSKIPLCWLSGDSTGTATMLIAEVYIS